MHIVNRCRVWLGIDIKIRVWERTPLAIAAVGVRFLFWLGMWE